MRGSALRGVHIVAVTHNRRTEYWAVSTVRSEAVHSVRKLVPPDAKIRLLKSFLSHEQIGKLNLSPQEIRRLPDLTI